MPLFSPAFDDGWRFEIYGCLAVGGRICLPDDLYMYIHFYYIQFTVPYSVQKILQYNFYNNTTLSRSVEVQDVVREIDKRHMPRSVGDQKPPPKTHCHHRALNDDWSLFWGVSSWLVPPNSKYRGTFVPHLSQLGLSLQFLFLIFFPFFSWISDLFSPRVLFWTLSLPFLWREGPF